MRGYKKHPSLGVVALLGLLSLVILHIFAIEFYLYWFYWWLDILFHLLGGSFVGLAAIWFLKSFFSSFRSTLEERPTAVVFGSVFVIAILWEVFEHQIGCVDPAIGKDYWLDTFTDVIATMLGGALSLIVSFYSDKLSN
ncbi:MAG: hypothetical protein ACLFNR_01185 [Candidatus Paceibacterota bacterium]